ncbi:MAG TPA: hypothetical protein DCO73_04155, partial [Alphaproteobacteria bacterium]|nr:hypothetical protein [Alphaproteobacteria bacterium]
MLAAFAMSAMVCGAAAAQLALPASTGLLGAQGVLGELVGVALVDEQGRLLASGGLLGTGLGTGQGGRGLLGQSGVLGSGVLGRPQGAAALLGEDALGELLTSTDGLLGTRGVTGRVLGIAVIGPQGPFSNGGLLGLGIPGGQGGEGLLGQTGLLGTGLLGERGLLGLNINGGHGGLLGTGLLTSGNPGGGLLGTGGVLGTGLLGEPGLLGTGLLSSQGLIVAEAGLLRLPLLGYGGLLGTGVLAQPGLLGTGLLTGTDGLVGTGLLGDGSG